MKEGGAPSKSTRMKSILFLGVVKIVKKHMGLFRH